MTKLDRALIANDTEVIRSLLDADPDRVDREDIKGVTPMLLAVSRSDVSVVELLILRGADVNKREHIHGNFPLFQAVARRRKDIVELLLLYGADTTIRDSDGESAHDLAVTMDQTDLADLLAV